ncbi:MAG: GNAT family acetyltransferase [Xanthobacteraceae bacterium]
MATAAVRHGTLSPEPGSLSVGTIGISMPTDTKTRKNIKLSAGAEQFDNISRIIFALSAGVLMLLAIALTIDAVIQFTKAILGRQGIGIPALSGIGTVVVSIAVFDVAKYLIEEEVLRGREMRVASEARRSLTQFVSTIAIAVFLEALVTIFRVSQDNVTLLFYPTALLLCGILLVVGLGVYQRLSASIEAKVDRKDKAAGNGPDG